MKDLIQCLTHRKTYTERITIKTVEKIKTVVEKIS